MKNPNGPGIEEVEEWKDELESIGQVKQELLKAHAEIYKLHDRIAKADRVLERLGYRHCDIPACACDGYHYHV